MKFKYLSIFLLGASLTGLTACNDYLDVEPQSDITPAAFFTTADDLAAYTINLYNSTFDYISPGSYGISIFGWDNDTDNQAAVRASAQRWVPGQWKVGTSNYWTKDNWAKVRNINYFFDQVLPKYEAGEISGGSAVNHYIGEAYVIRALTYFNFLQAIGDCPIITTAMNDIEEELVAASVRQPRHKVARFIIDDLNKAIGEMVFYQNIEPELFEVDAYPTTDSTHGKVVYINGEYQNQAFEQDASGSPATGDATVYVVVSLAVSTIALAAVAVVRKQKEN